MKQFVGSGSEIISRILAEPRTNLGIVFLSENDAEAFCIKSLVDFVEGTIQAFMSNNTTERKISEMEFLENLKHEFHSYLQTLPDLSHDFVANSVVAFQSFIEERVKE